MTGLRLCLLATLAMLPVGAVAQSLGQQSLSQSSYVIDKDGRLFAFGLNTFGQLGVGDKTNRSKPVEVPVPQGGSRWIVVAGGAYHALAIADSDKLYAWGSNRFGQLGIGKSGERVVPALVPNPEGVKSWKWVTAGRDHSLALSSDGRLFAWGNNDQGQLGTGNLIMQISPVIVPGGARVTAWSQVAAGDGYTLAVSSDGQLFGWGIDSLGSCYSMAPALASSHYYRTETPLSTVSAGIEWESCVLDDGHYGDGWSEPGDGYQFAMVSSGAYHAFGLTVQGALECIGQNNHGQLGTGDTITKHVTRTRYPGGENQGVSKPFGVSQWLAVAGGYQHSLAIGNDGWLYAWGDNSSGQLGLGSGPDVWRPTKVMRVGDTIMMTGSLGAPLLVEGEPFSVQLTVRNLSSAFTLTNASGDLVPSAYLYRKDSAMHEDIRPTSIAPQTSDSAVWQIVAVQYTSRLSFAQPVTDTIISFVIYGYVRARGSAALLVSRTIQVHALPLNELTVSRVIDSLTRVGVPRARVTFLDFLKTFSLGGVAHDTTSSRSNGALDIRFTKAGTYEMLVAKENYRSGEMSLSVPLTGDTIPTIELGPAPVIGTFERVNLPTQTPFTSIYFPDSIVGFAAGKNIIWKTTDTGATWTQCFISHTPGDFTMVRFVNPIIGIAVGAAGHIAETSDAGATWTERTNITTEDLTGVTFSARDTAWIIGTHGTLLKREGTVWTPQQLDTITFTSIHFFDAQNGVIVSARSLSPPNIYIMDDGRWIAASARTVNPRAAVMIWPRNIIAVGDGSGQVSNAEFGPATHFQSTYIQQPINRLWFLNSNVGFAAADSSSSLVTYDRGLSWAPLEEVRGNAGDLSFFGLNGWLATSNGPMVYRGHASATEGIVRGHTVYADHLTGIRGAAITRTFSVRNGAPVDETFTDELGNFAFPGIADTFHYDYKMYYEDSGNSKTYTWKDIRVKAGQVIVLSFAVPAPPPPPPPPPPDTQRAAAPSAEAYGVTFLLGRQSQSRLEAMFTLPGSGQTKLSIFDITGRLVQNVDDTRYTGGDHTVSFSVESLRAGVYYARLLTNVGALTRSFIITR